MRILVTGGAGFIGSAVVRYLIQHTSHSVLNLDALTYAGNLDSLTSIECDSRYQFQQVDIRNLSALSQCFDKFQPQAVMHLAAESHVDRSIDGPSAFIETNITGTYNLLDTARAYWQGLETEHAVQFRFHHISTDEVYGSLGTEGKFTEETPYAPNSPYSASKAASDHLVRAWHHTYGLPTIMTNCSNNYGPFQFPEKLIPLMIIKALRGECLPVYGDGSNVRDWLYVEDHARALYQVLTEGRVGETYNIGGDEERTNLEVVKTICGILDKELPGNEGQYDRLIEFVADRPGHDQRYAIDATKIGTELKWQPKESFESGMNQTILWYLDNREWWQRIESGVYRQERIGLGTSK